MKLVLKLTTPEFTVEHNLREYTLELKKILFLLPEVVKIVLRCTPIGKNNRRGKDWKKCTTYFLKRKLYV